MREIYELAEFMFCGWRLAFGARPVVVGDGRLDVAVERHLDFLPDRLRAALSFGVTRVGFRCYELEDVLFAAQANLLAEGSNLGRAALRPVLDDGAARTILARRRFPAADAERYARALSATMDSPTKS